MRVSKTHEKDYSRENIRFGGTNSACKCQKEGNSQTKGSKGYARC
jgi:hypothetical protein